MEKNDKIFNITVSLVTCVVFFGTLTGFEPAGLGAATAFSEKKEFSETKNQYLAKFPEFTAKKVYNGSFAKGVEDFLSDHFVGHDGWITVKTAASLAAGMRESNDIYILKDRLVEKIPAPDPAVTAQSIEGIKKFAADNDIIPYVMIVPTQAEIYKNELPADAPNPDQKAFIDSVYSELSGSAATIDVYTTLNANRKDYIYYRTDHHWTTKGAFLAYTEAAKKMNFEPMGESSFDIDHAGHDFRGTFYSKVLFDSAEPDTVDIWLPSEKGDRSVLEIYKNYGEEPMLHDGMYFREFLDVKDKYSTFFGQNMPMINVITGNPGGRLLVIKDSYAHSLVPFLANHYSEICMLDLRYIQISYKELVNVADYDAVLFVYNASTFMSDDDLKKLKY